MLRNRLTNVAKAIKQRGFSTSFTEETYPGAMKALHWTMGIGIIGCVGCVKYAQQFNFKGNSDNDKKKYG